MSRIHLVRHGQGGTRKAYDSLSERGRRQARLLGEYLAAQRVQFSSAYSGEMIRQQQTAEECRAAYLAAGLPFPDLQLEPRWNEFDLDQVYKDFAPHLAAADAEFQQEYDEMRLQARAAADDPHAAVHRRWMPSDVKVVAAWLRGSHLGDGETWEAFRTRVASNYARLAPAERDSNIVIFTSATPIGIWTAQTMDITDERVMKLAGSLYNASWTVIKLHGAQSRLHTFNAIPHLTTPDLRTYR